MTDLQKKNLEHTEHGVRTAREVFEAADAKHKEAVRSAEFSAKKLKEAEAEKEAASQQLATARSRFFGIVDEILGHDTVLTWVLAHVRLDFCVPIVDTVDARPLWPWVVASSLWRWLRQQLEVGD